MTRRCMRIQMYENTPCHSRFWEWAKGFSIIHRNAYVFVRSGWGPASGFVGVQGMCNKHLPKWDLWRFGIPGYEICLLFEWVVPHLEVALTLTTFLNNKLVFSGLCLLSFGLVWVVAWSQTKSVLRLPSWSWLSALEKDRSVPLSFKVLGMGKRIFWAHGMYGNNLPKSVLISFDQTAISFLHTHMHTMAISISYPYPYPYP